MGKKGLVFKIDFEKAYDHIEWSFVDFVMEKKGFGSKWRKWIRGCLSSVSYSIMLNGRPRGKFKGSRGLRQGDPLSPFLFTLVVDVLGRLVDKAKEQSIFRGLEVGRESISISHLQFADDTLFFINEEERFMSALTNILDIFCLMSGLKINMSKSILLGVNMDEAVVRAVAGDIGCSIGSWPIRYLGLPLGGNPLKSSFWEPVVEKVSKRLDGWSLFVQRG